MNSAGEVSNEEIDKFVKVVRALMSSGDSLEQALEHVPTYLREHVQGRWLADRVQVEPVAMLTRGGARPWFADWDPAQGYHWSRLRDFLLLEKGRSETVLESLDQSTDKVLSMLEDPKPGGPSKFQVRGLVVGYVQSGKTANFSALIAKGFDAGYRTVIVLSGLHNSLRRQTQLRLEDELGLVPSTPTRKAVGLAEQGKQIVAMTGAETWQDFHPGTVRSDLLYSGVNLILVVKKNASVLRRLVRWFEERRPYDAPVLIIDDEADQASINTGGNREPDPPLEDLIDLTDDDVEGGPKNLKAQLEETDPSVINALLRRLLDGMERVSYVGYTATPFANVLIDKDALDREVGEDLYPRDFIISLPRPPGYVGTEALFGRSALAGEEDGVAPLDVIERVPYLDADLLTPGRNAPPNDTVPESLENALMDFVLAMAARDARVGGAPAASMLIHGSAYTAQQLPLAEGVRRSLATLRQRWRYDKAQCLPVLQERWNSSFVPVSKSMSPDRAMSFDSIEPMLDRNFRTELPVMVLNNRTDDELDYERNPNIRAVVVGGNKLSRGLTIEGLLVSYYVRPANYFDTLLQMGRWFGYRADYVDLTRLYTTEELRLRFRDLATAEESLRREIRLYDVLGKTPDDFAPRIMAHKSMQITASNRMGSAREISADYNGSLIQTTLFELGRREWLEENLWATREFLSSLGVPNAEQSGPDDPQPTWRDIDWRLVVRFFESYKTHKDSQRFISAQLKEYVHEQASKYHEVTRWWVSIRGRKTPSEQLGSEDLSIPNHKNIACISRSREKHSDISIGTLVNPVSKGSRGGDEEVGLSEEAIKTALELASKDVSYATALRQQRNPGEGLLLVYPISRYGVPTRGDGRPLFENPDRDGVTVVGIAAVLPYSESGATVRYVVGSAGPAEV